MTVVKDKKVNSAGMAIERNSHSRVKSMKMHIMDMMGLLAKNKKIRLETNNTAYNNTLDRDVIAAIKRIEKEESAVLEMAYPLQEHSMLHGFMGLKSYLLNLFYENSFCSEYNNEDIRWLLENYCCNKGKNEEEVCFNIYSAVYVNALFCDYLKKEYGTLKLTDRDCKLAQTLLAPLNDEEREEILFSCARRMTHGSLAYNNKTFMRILPSIITAIKRKNIASVVTIEK